MKFIRSRRTISALVGTVVIVAMVSGLMTFGGLFLLAMDPSQKITLADMIVVSVVGAVVVLSVGLAIIVVFHDRMFTLRRCLHCAYSLEGLPTARCPECGHVNESSGAEAANDPSL